MESEDAILVFAKTIKGTIPAAEGLPVETPHSRAGEAAE